MPNILSKEFLRSVPHKPGVYLMRGENDRILYVGKAKDLRKRLSSYTRALHTNGSKTGIMLGKVQRIETVLTATEKEAFILEASFIKKEKPKYNIILRDDKNYPLIKVTVQEEWPRLVMTRRFIRDGARYFGPYTSSSSMWETIRILRQLFPLRKCKGAVIKTRKRPCLDAQMGRCLAPCFGGISHSGYMHLVEEVLMVLEGRNAAVVQSLQKEMQQAAEDLSFEKAAALRDKIQALNRTIEKQVVVSSNRTHRDVFGLAREDDAVSIAVLHVRHGTMNGYQNYYLNNPVGSDAGILAEVLARFYGEGRLIPREVLVPQEPEHCGWLRDWLHEKKGTKVTVRAPQRGEGVRLIEMAQKNARHLFIERQKQRASWETLSQQIQERLRLTQPPTRMICFDISNTGGQQSVGAVVSFLEGKKESKGYRHYKIKTVEGPDDYASMKEVLERHLIRAAEADFLPNVVVVDGGRGQLQQAVQVVRELALEEDIDLVGIAKERGDEGEKLYRPGRKNPILLDRHSKVLLLLMQLRDEAHRFGITFHRKWRQKDLLTSELDSIPGVGPARKKSLLSTLGSLKAVRQASVEELQTVPGISLAVAQKIYHVLRERN